MDQDGGRFEAQSVSRAGTDANVGLLCGGRLPSAAYGAAEHGRGGVSGARRAAGCPSGRTNAGAAGGSADASGESGQKSALGHT
jgi:hypothetical protein